MKKVFLGGTCNNSKWREDLIKKLDKTKVDYFNPVVDDWTDDCKKEEIRQRENCDYCLYVITPKMTGVYSIAEIIDDSNKRPEKTIVCILMNDAGQLYFASRYRSLIQVASLAESNGARIFATLDQIAKFLNEGIEY